MRFPRDKFDCFYSEASPATAALFPKDGEKLSELKVVLKYGGMVEVDGFGMPYDNQEHEFLHDWVNRNAPIIVDVTIVDLISSNRFHFVVDCPYHALLHNFHKDRLSPPSNYPYGNEHGWNIDRDCAILAANKSKHQFRAARR